MFTYLRCDWLLLQLVEYAESDTLVLCVDSVDSPSILLPFCLFTVLQELSAWFINNFTLIFCNFHKFSFSFSIKLLKVYYNKIDEQKES